VIDSVFAANGIQLKADVPYDVLIPAGIPFVQVDTVRVTLDGYNDALKVGYEFIGTPEDFEEFHCVGSRESMFEYNSRVIDGVDSATAHLGPHVKVANRWGTPAGLARTMQDFIDTLKAHGAI